ncbi:MULTISPECIES: two-component system histidine kinase PnpS [Clostridium]|uniref:two-component system histidine kinase PnpS n=1 Tax=Clostridium TaxID=1485 RepID=UPI0023556162|nr:ATP-binding protein [Clostridium thermopalmarium]MBE6044162.1 HAMP domain-containing protein [Clostridium thermopalmarium]
MRNKLTLSILSNVILSLILITPLYMIMINYQQEEIIKRNLKSNNELTIRMIESKSILDIDKYFNSFNKSSIRVTLIDKNGLVLKDSEGLYEDMDNHNIRKEIVDARKQGYGYSVRYSKSLQRTMIYYATSFNNGYIVRSSMPMEVVMGLERRYLKYYLVILGIVFFVSFLFSSKLSYVIVKPLKELEFITFRIAKGEYDRRVNIVSQDEIGQLAKTFNHMADQLQYTLKDSLEKQNKLESILKSMDSGVIAVDKEYKVIMINPYAQKIFGIKEDIIGKNLMNFIKDYELGEIFKNSEDNKEIQISWPEKKILKIKTADIISNKRRIGIVAVVQDITDIKRLENMRSQFVANVSHELKTPLTSIKGFAETLKYVEDKDTREKFLSIINDETDRLTRLISDILILSDLEQHKEFKVKEDIDVTEAIINVYNLMKNTADKKGVKLQTECNENITIIGDKDKFKQMLINLIDNAIKYSERGDFVLIKCKNGKNVCVITIEDTGVGIPKEHIPRLFERFYRVDKARSRSRGGTGLGLAIVKHIVLSFKGEIFVESEIGKGTKFIVKIPLK